MTSSEIRQAFLDFFKSKGHKIVPSAPIVVKNDPTLMFINSGMAPFKDFFLGNQTPPAKRIADTQKCLRVSGKHNDLEEVGVDTYHHTMFEMLGNWSFGDYFKKEAIQWSWELLTEVYKLEKDRLYVTVFEGDPKENLGFDQDSYNEWKKYVAEDRILKGNKKDNFWEMGDTGPCGPCSEIHIDLRDDSERAKVPGDQLVNQSDPQVIEIWNNVFMEFQRKADGSLEKLPAQHVDTGMGFERLCVAIQKKKSNYDTDVFQPTIQHIAAKAGKKYGESEKTDIAMRVIADHIRAISFTIADGQLLASTGAGYVIRRILRRAVRYGYSYLGFEQPFLFELVGLIAEQFAAVFPELKAQKDFVAKVIFEEEASFLRTLSQGIRKFESLEKEASKTQSISGKDAFELYDTFGFPLDLTQLMASERGWTVNQREFDKELQIQKERSRKAATSETGDWITVGDETPTQFIGYDHHQSDAHLVKYRKVKAKDAEVYQLVLDKTPFYAESGGQVGDTGVLDFGGEKIDVLDTKKENDLIIHFTKKLPSKLEVEVAAKINVPKRNDTIKNHSATHLLQAALRQVLGHHVQQKGSLVNPDYLRFDFSHFSKVTTDELAQVEKIVNDKIMENVHLEEQRNVPFQKAVDSGVTALFGEKYGEFVRVITFDRNFSSELCGGCHVPATGVIGLFKIISESSTAAGVRRIEAVTGRKALEYVNKNIADLTAISEILNNPKNIIKAVEELSRDNDALKKEVESFVVKETAAVKNELLAKKQTIGGVTFIGEIVSLSSADAVKNLCYMLKGESTDFVFAIGANIGGKTSLHIMIAEHLVKDKNWNAGAWIKEVSPLIKGGGGGQPFYASAGGTNTDGLQAAIDAVRTKLS
ncbi:MAG: alanine--tRNA ligase [Bacteroidetes bacterium]|nr:alanine--tRNA ligase [Bacteroidota bacterium]